MQFRFAPSIRRTVSAAFIAASLASSAGCSSDANQPTAPMDSGAAGDSGGVGVADSGDAGSLDAGPLDITTKSGPVHGKTTGTTRAFLGIPYAAPPTGPNRWRAPQPVTPWTMPLDATMPAKVCPQIQVAGTTMDPRSAEDCLTLNVWTPDPAPASALPVMVWIHGGAFVFGSGAETYYDGSHLIAAGNVVVVTMNYRLGALGFLAHPALTAESANHPTSGNYGFEDQQAALRWVKDNISGFGGDPGKVTIFGESAGGLSVCAHLIAPASQGLFQGAISESGLCSSPLKPTRDQAYPNGQALATALGCTDSATVLTCLRSKTPADLLGAFSGATSLPGGLFYQGRLAPADGGTVQGSQTWNPVVDTTVIPVPIATVGPGFAKVPLLLGTNANEGTVFSAPGIFGGTPVSSDAEYQAAVARTFPTQATQILAQYPSSAFPSPNDALNEATTDAFFTCPARRQARAAATAGSNVYLYVFTHVPEQPIQQNLGSFHSAELSYVFGADPGLATTKDDEKPLIATMQGYWTRFAHAGDPNGGGAPAWPKYSQSGDQDLSLNLPTPSVETGHKSAKCDFWDSVGP
jgi:para-nitrobenzyl esterase